MFYLTEGENEMIYVTGDLHGELDIKKLFTFDQKSNLRKNDFLVILGDFGFVWNNTETDVESYWLDWLNVRRWTTLFIDGNHENFSRLLQYPEKERFGGLVGELRPSVLHLKQRGAIYEIPEGFSGKAHKCWCFGGARSIDKIHRTEGLSWWKEEMPSRQEYDFGLASLRSVENTVDFIFTHDAPYRVVDELSAFNFDDSKYEVTEYFQQVSEIAKFKAWYFGHHHIDGFFDICGKKYNALYDKFLKLE